MSKVTALSLEEARAYIDSIDFTQIIGKMVEREWH